MGEPVTGESQRFISENMLVDSESGRMIVGTANGDQTAMLPLTATVRRSREERIA